MLPLALRTLGNVRAWTALVSHLKSAPYMPFVVWGPTGCGKSCGVRDALAFAGYEVVELDGADAETFQLVEWVKLIRESKHIESTKALILDDFEGFTDEARARVLEVLRKSHSQRNLCPLAITCTNLRAPLMRQLRSRVDERAFAEFRLFPPDAIVARRWFARGIEVEVEGSNSRVGSEVEGSNSRVGVEENNSRAGTGNEEGNSSRGGTDREEGESIRSYGNEVHTPAPSLIKSFFVPPPSWFAPHLLAAPIDLRRVRLAFEWRHRMERNCEGMRQGEREGEEIKVLRQGWNENEERRPLPPISLPSKSLHDSFFNPFEATRRLILRQLPPETWAREAEERDVDLVREHAPRLVDGKHKNKDNVLECLGALYDALSHFDSLRTREWTGRSAVAPFFAVALAVNLELRCDDVGSLTPSALRWDAFGGGYSLERGWGGVGNRSGCGSECGMDKMEKLEKMSQSSTRALADVPAVLLN